MLNQSILSIISKEAIEKRTTNNLEMNSLANQLFPRTNSILTIALIVVTAGTITINKLAPQMVKKASIVELQDTSQRNAVSGKKHSPITKNLHKQMSIRLIQTPQKVTITK